MVLGCNTWPQEPTIFIAETPRTSKGPSINLLYQARRHHRPPHQPPPCGAPARLYCPPRHLHAPRQYLTLFLCTIRSSRPSALLNASCEPSPLPCPVRHVLDRRMNTLRHSHRSYPTSIVVAKPFGTPQACAESLQARSDITRVHPSSLLSASALVRFRRATQTLASPVSAAAEA